MGWPTVQFRDNEDPVAIRRRFAELWARNPDQTTAWVGFETFKGMPLPIERGGMAGAQWPYDSEVIAWRDAFLRDGVKTEADRDNALRLAWGIANDLKAQNKDRLKALEYIAQVENWISTTKPDDTPAGAQLPVYNVMRYPDEDSGTGHTANRAAV
jgi:hypothetical protein